jgi:tetratricopeptide (TPR) repeat protein
MRLRVKTALKLEPIVPPRTRWNTQRAKSKICGRRAVLESFRGWGDTDMFCGAVLQPLLEAHADEPAAPTVRLSAAWLLVAVGRRDEAMRSLEGLVGVDDKNLAAEASLLVGRIALEKGDWEAALSASARAAEGLAPDSPGHALARWRMARALEENGRDEEAAVHYRWLVEHAKDAEVLEASQVGLMRIEERTKKVKHEAESK